MKTYLVTAFALIASVMMYAQSDSLGLPGDDLDLCGVLQLFKESKSPDAFEKSLNKKDNKINNLDLNADGKVDYLRVIDNSKSDAHALIIRDDISKTESQDVAVIEIEKKGEKNARLQIVGDEELYGKDYIIEPKPDKPGNEGKWRGFYPDVVIVNVWYWPCVSYLWYPDYVIWVSPFYWGYYPSWWYPWAPMPYYMYYDVVYVYHDYYYWTDVYRCPDAHTIYQPRRVVSASVHQRIAPQQRRAAEREKAAPRRTPGAQNPVPARKPTTTQEAPRRDGNNPPTPQQKGEPRQKNKSQQNPPAPQRTDRPRHENRNPQQNPPQPRQPRRGPVIHPSPAPRPAPTPRPTPPPRPPSSRRPR